MIPQSLRAITGTDLRSAGFWWALQEPAGPTMAILEPSSVSLQTDSACTGPCQRRFGTPALLSRGYSASGSEPLPQKKDSESTPEAKVFPPEQSMMPWTCPYQHRQSRFFAPKHPWPRHNDQWVPRWLPAIHPSGAFSSPIAYF